MSEPTDISCSDDLFNCFIEASYCSFILLVLRRLDRPASVNEVADQLSLKFIACQDLFDLLLQFNFILPQKNSDKFIITPAGIELISPKPLSPPWEFDPLLPYEGDRLPTYIAFDLLPLRIYSFRRGIYSMNPGNLN